MPTIRLTQAAVEKLKPPAAGRVTYWDRHLPSFGLRITQTGAKSWVAVSRINRKLIWHTLGTLAQIPKVDEARARARASQLLAKDGINPVVERKREKSAAVTAAARFHTVDEIVALYLKRHVDPNYRASTAKEVHRQFAKDVLPRWGKRDINSITRADVRRLLDELQERGPSTANHVLAVLKTFFRWSAAEEFIPREQNPIIDLKPPSKNVQRDRILNDDEVVAFWNGCDRIGWPYGPLFKLLLLTAQRRTEVGHMEWTELDPDNKAWTIPGNRAKNGKPHIVHLTGPAIEVLNSVPLVNGSAYVFSTTGRVPVTGWNAGKSALDKHVSMAEPFTLHDLRRTAASGMARIGIAPQVVDRVLNHTAGTIKGVARIYNRYEYGDERQAALEAWSRYVAALLHPGSDQKVVPLAAHR